MTDAVSGRRVLAALGVIVVAICAYVGYVIGVSHAGSTDAIRVFGRVALPLSPLAMAAYGGGLALLLLAALFGAVSLASQYEAESTEE